MVPSIKENDVGVQEVMKRFWIGEPRSIMFFS